MTHSLDADDADRDWAGPSAEPVSLCCWPIGVLRCADRSKFATPSQAGGNSQGVIELSAGLHLDVAVRELSGFSRIWLLWWFHRNSGWRPEVLPPRGRGGRKGVLATRSPHRPNPIGMSSVALLEVRQTRLYVGAHDLLDGTPILDIKPYLPEVDSFPEERSGWLEQLPPSGHYELICSPLARRQLDWLAEHQHPELVERIRSLLGSDPWPHRTRRITVHGDGYLLKCGSWRVFYQIHHRQVRVERVASRSRARSSSGCEAGLLTSFEAEFEF